MLRGWSPLLLVAVACGSSSPASAPAPPPAADAAAAAAPTPPPPAPSPPPFPATVRSLLLDRSIAIRFLPGDDAKNLGTIAKDTRVGWRGAAAGPGCKKRWIEIEPRGWICESYLTPTEKPPTGVELPKLGRGELVPGGYGKVTVENARTYATAEDASAHKTARTLAGAVKVRRFEELVVGGRRFWRIGPRELLAARDISELTPSTFTGARLGDDTGRALPLGFAFPPRGDKTARIKVWSVPAAVGTPLRTIPARTPIGLLETAPGPDGAPLAYRVGSGEWVRAIDVRVADLAAAPPATGPDERWIDIDVDRQVLVAYEGPLPVFATLVSTGEKRYPTETGVYRVWVKFAETDMNGQMGDEAPYSVATVPWTQFFAKDLALHTSYWHDRFGEARSHGCINLAPLDARWLYFWSQPDVPPGWSMAHGVVERPGSLVRVRSKADPAPELRGYARRVYEARTGQPPPAPDAGPPDAAPAGSAAPPSPAPG